MKLSQRGSCVVFASGYGGERGLRLVQGGDDFEFRFNIPVAGGIAVGEIVGVNTGLAGYAFEHLGPADGVRNSVKEVVPPEGAHDVTRSVKEVCEPGQAHFPVDPGPDGIEDRVNTSGQFEGIMTKGHIEPFRVQVIGAFHVLLLSRW